MTESEQILVETADEAAYIGLWHDDLRPAGMHSYAPSMKGAERTRDNRKRVEATHSEHQHRNCEQIPVEGLMSLCKRHLPTANFSQIQ